METMNLPEVVSELVKAQNRHDSIVYANCFAETAVVVDEGQTYNGRTEIERWIKNANENYKIIMKPVRYTETGLTGVLSAEVSGSFDGSPLVLHYHLVFIDGFIQSLKVSI
ncbi:hypothetical protein Palpr_0338 [Paludibacter propionicigenes WB4]|uniref:SnoaL-like domain-containing protein n=1 Tax=Paludibacter propionicigenes (strain DSM 17365 / JCM 13257 / WB4) TaxID=694427 RepID=E4T1A5_PALPW|nr:nuclear transport factor 2 family protein [Paludibacter propionicigenes]ADQ78499.1 hypothetical protein Palpr_0338 [Paludibacter propionicigenes WB4]